MLESGKTEDSESPDIKKEGCLTAFALPRGLSPTTLHLESYWLLVIRERKHQARNLQWLLPESIGKPQVSYRHDVFDAEFEAHGFLFSYKQWHSLLH